MNNRDKAELAQPTNFLTDLAGTNGLKNFCTRKMMSQCYSAIRVWMVIFGLYPYLCIVDQFVHQYQVHTTQIESEISVRLDVTDVRLDVRSPS